MTGSRIGLLALALLGALLLYAWIDGGAEPVRPITQPIDAPEGFR